MRRCAGWLLVALSGCAAEKANGRPWVHDLMLQGVKQVSSRDLKSKIALEKTSWIPFSPKKYLDPFTVDLDQKRIEAYYAAHGYFAARVTAAEVKPRGHDGKSVDVRLVVDEGVPTRIASLATDGLDPLGPDAVGLQRRLVQRLKRGEVFDHDKYVGAKKRLESRLKSLGFAWAEVRGEVDVNRDAHAADVRLDVAPGQKARFGHVSVRGSARVQPKLILMRAGIDEGATFDPQVIEDARGRIYNTGVFASVKIDYQHDPTQPELADVIINVHEGQLRELRLGGGVNFESTRYDVHLAAQYLKHSFLGGLRTLQLRLEPGWVFLVNPQSIGAPTGGPSNGPSLKSAATFTQPDWLWRLLELKWLVGYDLGIDYAYQYHGPRTTLGVNRPFWGQHVHVGLSYNFNFLLFFNTVPAFTEDPRAAARLYGYTSPYRVGWWQEDLALDLRDKPLTPHQGAYAAVTFEEGGSFAGGTFAYEKVQPQLRLYAPLGKRVTVAARGELGQLFVQGAEGSPITRRFFMGGPDSHRGFNYNRLSLQVPSGLKGAPNLPIGGDQLLLLQAELRVDVVKLLDNWFGVTAFVDAGDVAAPTTGAGANVLSVIGPSSVTAFPGVCGDGREPRLATTVELSKLHTAVGAGLRYRTVIGVIRADVGVRLNRTTACESDGTPNPDPGSRVAFHISIGESF
jgi:outer membrane protein assembly factor BamA